jgi:hypothetical protein
MLVADARTNDQAAAAAQVTPSGPLLAPHTQRSCLCELV